MNIDGHHVIMLKTILQFSCIVIFQKVLEGFSVINLFYICVFAWSLYVSDSDQIMTLGIKCHLKFTAVLTKFCPTLKGRPENDTAT